MKDIDTLRFETADWAGYEGDNTGNAYYLVSSDTIGLYDDNPKTVIHELCERDVLDLIGHKPIQSTTVSHIMSLYKGARWGRWRTWGEKP